jgi:hypothetical protein
MSQSKFGDFLNFKVMISPVLLLVLFWLGMVAIVFAAIVLFAQRQMLIGVGIAVFGPFAWRIICEYMIIGFRIHACLEQIAKNTETGFLQKRDISPKKQNSDRSELLRQRVTEYGMLLSDISVGEHFETRDGKEFKVLEFTRNGLRVEFAGGTREILSPIDSGIPEESWTFDIRRT